MRTILDYATEDDLGEYRQQLYAVRRAEAETKKVVDALQRVYREVNELERAKVYELRAAGQRAMGSDVVVPSAASKRAELNEQLNGLQVLLKEAQEGEKVATGDLRRAAMKLLRTCAERCAEDYVRAATTLGWCWTQLSAVSNLNPVTDMFLKDLGHAQLCVPGSQSVEVIRQQTRHEWGKAVILSNDRLAKKLESAASDIRKHAADTLGTWPL